MDNLENILSIEEAETLNLAKIDERICSLKKRSEYEDWIDNLSFDANTKNILKKLLDFTIVACGKVYQMGKAIVDFVMHLKESYPKTFDLAALGFIFSLLVLCLPVVGKFLFPIVCPIFVLLGGAAGLVADLGTDMLIKSKINEWFGSGKKEA